MGFWVAFASRLRLKMSSLDSTLGVMELGGIFSTLLFGITTVQTFNYYRDYPRDAVILRTVVRGRPTHSVSALTEHCKVGSIWFIF
jgi:4-hydroxybenzoate polyprenyltransferase